MIPTLVDFLLTPSQLLVKLVVSGDGSLERDKSFGHDKVGTLRPLFTH